MECYYYVNISNVRTCIFIDKLWARKRALNVNTQYHIEPEQNEKEKTFTIYCVLNRDRKILLQAKNFTFILISINHMPYC